MNEQTEILLDEREERLVLFPIKYPEIWKLYKKQIASFWTVEEVDLTKDINDWNQMNDNERMFIENILAFFAGSDGLVNMNIGINFINEIKILEAKYVYNVQSTIEGIHAEMYSVMIDTYIKDSVKKDKLFNGIKTIKCVEMKAVWAFKWINHDNVPFAQRLIAFAIVEGLFFSGSFCAIYWLKQRNLMPGLTLSNEFISRDEGSHVEFACLLYSMIKNRIDEATVYLMMDEALKIEKEFIIDSLPCKLIGMNSESMIQYLEYVADRLLGQLNYKKKYNSSNPFSFMEMINLEGKTNFFEHRPTQYQKATLTVKKDDKNIEINDDF